MVEPRSRRTIPNQTARLESSLSASVLQTLDRGYHCCASRLRNSYYRLLGANLTGYVWMRAIEIPRNWRDITIENGVSLDRGVTLLCSGTAQPDKLVIRSGSYVNRHTMLDAHQHLEIGADCMIGPYCYFTDANHGMDARTTIKAQPMNPAPLLVQAGCWIGAHVTVLAGVCIGRGAVIGAGSVVTSDIPPNTVAVGVPARVIRTRTELPESWSAATADVREAHTRL
jgi:carbonic anhydrase/acetyltransferase-like protein (isoleucine patch superfamily)